MDIRAAIILLTALVALATCTEDGGQLNERESEELRQTNVVPTDVDEDLNENKRGGSRIFRYGRGGSVFRYGKRAPVFRYGKRGPSVFRYGKREDSNELVLADSELGDYQQPWKRLFRWGKRDDSDDYKRVFRWGKRSNDDFDDDVKRQVFRYGKRDDLDTEIADMLKAKVSDLGNDVAFEEGDIDKRARIFRYGRSRMLERDARAKQPHVPFRFGE